MLNFRQLNIRYSFPFGVVVGYISRQSEAPGSPAGEPRPAAYKWAGTGVAEPRP